MTEAVESPVALIIEDEVGLAEVESDILAGLGCHTHLAMTGADGLRAARLILPDLVLLDLGLPDVEGMSICRAILGLRRPRVMVVTGVLDGDTATTALELGADDYVRKPFHLYELQARARAVLQRTGQVRSGSLKVGRLVIDRDACRVTVDGRPVELSATELRLLIFLAEHPGWVFSKEQLLGALWPGNRDAHSVQVHISNLRRRMEPEGTPESLIQTVKGLGYRLSPYGNGSARSSKGG
ncbi:response regulator transcription factor [bacterium]|nr:response regulator transcription factor [bacterium]